MEHVRYIRDHWPTERLGDLLAIISRTFAEVSAGWTISSSRSPSPILSVPCHSLLKSKVRVGQLEQAESLPPWPPGSFL